MTGARALVGSLERVHEIRFSHQEIKTMGLDRFLGRGTDRLRIVRSEALQCRIVGGGEFRRADCDGVMLHELLDRVVDVDHFVRPRIELAGQPIFHAKHIEEGVTEQHQRESGDDAPRAERHQPHSHVHQRNRHAVANDRIGQFSVVLRGARVIAERCLCDIER